MPHRCHPGLACINCRPGRSGGQPSEPSPALKLLTSELRRISAKRSDNRRRRAAERSFHFDAVADILGNLHQSCEMAKGRDFIPAALQPWIEARQRFRLTHAQVQMARELGLNPKKLGKIANHRQEPWKAPLPVFIERLYLKRYGKPAPDPVRSIEEIAAAQQAKKQARREDRNARKEAAADGLPADSTDATNGSDAGIPEGTTAKPSAEGPR